MTDISQLDQRALHLRREKALDQMKHAWYAAATASILGTLVLIYAGFDTGDWPTVVPYLGGLAGTLALGYSVGHEHSQWGAWLLMFWFAATTVIRWVETGFPTSLLTALVFGYFYYQGLMGAIDYADIEKTIKQRSAQSA